MREYKILPGVADDVAEAANWYDQQAGAGLGDRFIAAFFARIPHLLENGDIYRMVYADFRRILLQPFPYFLFYCYYGDLLVITLVIGAVRKPSLIRRVLQSRK